MLKKLAKYGNSTTLVIDKAILELLNMNESTIVKLKTDGKSLVITPVDSMHNQHEKVSYDTLEALIAAKQSFEKNRDSAQDIQDSVLVNEAHNDFKEVFQKHNQIFMKFNVEIFPSEAFQAALTELNAKIDPVHEVNAYYKAFNDLKVQFCPELADMQADIARVGEKYSKLS